MKLISCYIENFGKIKQKDFKFDDSITSIIQENGFGKTTLAEFIKAMFYGFESLRANAKEFLPREHYCPFGSDRFGGNITFKYKGDSYKIERFFDKKSETRDELKVYKNGEVVDEFKDQDIGKVIFGIDKASFERTAFITADEIEIKSTASINSKLNAFLQGSADDFDLTKVIENLEKSAKVYKKSNKAEDEITKVTREINSLNEKIANATIILNNLQEKRQRLDNYNVEYSELSSKIAKQNAVALELSEWERYESMLLDIENIKKEIDNIKSKYKNGVPSYFEVNEVQECLVKEKELLAKTESLGFTENEKLSLLKLGDNFKNALPSKFDVENAQCKINEYQNLNAKINGAQGDSLSSKQKDIVAKLSINTPTDLEVNEQTDLLNRRQDLTKQLSVIPRQIPSELSNKKPNSFDLIFLVVSLVLLCASIPLAISIGFIGYLLTGVAGVAFIVALVLFVNNKSKNKESVLIDNPNYLLLNNDLQVVEDRLKSFLMVHGYFTDKGISYDFATFLNEYGVYKDCLLTSSLYKQQIETQILKKNALQKELDDFFKNYGIYGDNYLSNLSLLQSNLSSYESLIAKKKDFDVLTKTYVEQSDKNKLIISSFKQKYNIFEIEPSVILVEINSYETLTKNAVELTKKAEELKKEKNLTVKPQVETDDNLTERFEFLRREISKLNLEISSDEFEVEALDGYIIDKDDATNRLENYKDKYRLLTLTTTYLLKAEQNLKDRYVKPVKDEFSAFAGAINDLLNEKVTMTKDFEIRFERNGAERSDKHLSSGLKSILAFCFRLALIKNMYKETSPFLVLDDPFVSLDAVHFEKVKKVIKTLASDMQIIYFTCHDSRKL